MSWSDITGRIQSSNNRVMGQSAVYVERLTGNRHILDVIWSGESTVVTAGLSGAEVETTQPFVDIKMSDLPVAPKHLDVVETGGSTYRILSTLPDGQGSMVLALEKIQS